MFAELYLPPELPVDRDEVEDAVAELFGEDVECVGAGMSDLGSNLDFEFKTRRAPDALAAALRPVLHGLNVVGGRIRVEGHEDWLDL